MAVLWYVQVRIHDASHVDVAWAVLIACAAILYALLADGDVAHRVLAAVLASMWGFRLGGYLYVNRIRGKEEDGRYQALRAKWGENANRNFFGFFQFQALFVVFFSLPFAFIALDPDSSFGASRGSGSRCGRSGTSGRSSRTVSSRSGARTRANKGKTARGGLWSWSRHPNYFFEWVNWCGIALVATTAPHGLDRVDRPRRPPVPPLPRDRDPGDGGASAALARRLRRVPADDERVRPAAPAARGGSPREGAGSNRAVGVRSVMGDLRARAPSASCSLAPSPSSVMAFKGASQLRRQLGGDVSAALP